jgi:hypothetical protein
MTAITTEKSASSTYPRITRDELKQALRARSANLNPWEMRAIVKQHPDLVSEEQLAKLKWAIRRMDLSKKLHTGAELKKSEEWDIVKDYPFLLKDDPKRLLELRETFHLVTPEERRIRSALEYDIQSLNPFDLIRAIDERRRALPNLTIEMLLGISLDQKVEVIEESSRLLKQKALSYDELKQIRAYKPEEQVELEQRHANGVATFRDLMVLRHVRPDLVSEEDIKQARMGWKK